MGKSPSVLLSLLIYSPPKSGGAHEINCLMDTKVYEGLSKVMEGFGRTRLHDKDIGSQGAQSATNGFPLGVVLHENSVTHKRELTKEVAAGLCGFFKEGGVLGNANCYCSVDNGTKALFGKSAS